MVADGELIEPANFHGILHNAVGNLLHRQINTYSHIATVTEIRRQIISARFQIPEGQELILALVKNCQQFFLGENILPGNLEAFDFHFEFVRQIQGRTGIRHGNRSLVFLVHILACLTRFIHLCNQLT